MKTKTHPIIKELQVNEDGTVIIYKGVKQNILIYNGKNYLEKRVNFMNKTHTVPKLVNETWNGMRLCTTMVTRRLDMNYDNDHYTNLYWGNKGNHMSMRSARSQKSKIQISDVPDVIERIKKGSTLRKIAEIYNTSDMTISRIKKRYITDPKKRLREAVMIAKNKHQLQQVCATYLGFDSLAAAIQNIGRYEFEKEVKQLKMTL